MGDAMSLYSVTVTTEDGNEQDLGFQMPYHVADAFAAQCNQRYRTVGRWYRATVVAQPSVVSAIGDDGIITTTEVTR